MCFPYVIHASYMLSMCCLYVIRVLSVSFLYVFHVLSICYPHVICVVLIRLVEKCVLPLPILCMSTFKWAEIEGGEVLSWSASCHCPSATLQSASSPLRQSRQIMEGDVLLPCLTCSAGGISAKHTLHAAISL